MRDVTQVTVVVQSSCRLGEQRVSVRSHKVSFKTSENLRDVIGDQLTCGQRGGDTKKKISLRNFRSDLGLWTSQWLHHVSDSGYVSQDRPTILPVLHDSLPTGTDTVSELLHPPSPKAPDSAPSSWVIVLNTHCLVLAFTDYVCSSICASDHKTRSSKTQQDSVSGQSVVTKKTLW